MKFKFNWRYALGTLFIAEGLFSYFTDWSGNFHNYKFFLAKLFTGLIFFAMPSEDSLSRLSNSDRFRLVVLTLCAVGAGYFLASFQKKPQRHFIHFYLMRWTFSSVGQSARLHSPREMDLQFSWLERTIHIREVCSSNLHRSTIISQGK